MKTHAARRGLTRGRRAGDGSGTDSEYATRNARGGTGDPPAARRARASRRALRAAAAPSPPPPPPRPACAGVSATTQRCLWRRCRTDRESVGSAFGRQERSATAAAVRTAGSSSTMQLSKAAMAFLSPNSATCVPQSTDMGWNQAHMWCVKRLPCRYFRRQPI
jgi:hypothetical protein